MYSDLFDKQNFCQLFNSSIRRRKEEKTKTKKNKQQNVYEFRLLLRNFFFNAFKVVVEFLEWIDNSDKFLSNL